MFFESQVAREAYEKLKDVDKDIKLHWVIAGKNPVCVRSGYYLYLYLTLVVI